jgi:cyclohexanone monooxygenase
LHAHAGRDRPTHLAFLIERARDEGLEWLEVSEQAEAEWVETILSRASLGDLQQTCTPSYYNNEGKPGEVSRQNFFSFGGPMEFTKIREDARAEDGMKGFELRKT